MQMFLYRLLRVREDAKVLLTDTDVCFRGDILSMFSESDHQVILNGNAEGLNIGMLYGKRTPGVPESEDPALKFYGDLDRRLRVLREDGSESDLVTCRNKVRKPGSYIFYKGFTGNKFTTKYLRRSFTSNRGQPYCTPFERKND